MSKRDHLVKGYLTEREKQQVRSWCAETGETQSEMVRNAVLEYIDRDRTARVEDEVRDLHTKVDDVLALLDDGDEHTHTRPTDALTTARQIIRRLQQNHDEVMRTADVDRAVEDYAGIDDRTKAKYKDLFRKRGLLFEHPGDPPQWTTETSVWTKWLKQKTRLDGPESAEEFVEPYPASFMLRAGGYEIEFDDVEAAADD